MTEQAWTLQPGGTLDVSPGWYVRSVRIDNPTPALVVVDLGTSDRSVQPYWMGTRYSATLSTRRVHVRSSLAAGGAGTQPITVTASDQRLPELAGGAYAGQTAAAAPMPQVLVGTNIGNNLITNAVQLPAGSYRLYAAQWTLSGGAGFGGAFVVTPAAGGAAVPLLSQQLATGQSGTVAYPVPVPFSSDGIHALQGSWTGNAFAPADGSVGLTVILQIGPQA